MAVASLIFYGIAFAVIVLYFTNMFHGSQKSLLFQSIHYFARPSSGIILEPIKHSANWLGKDLAAMEEKWKYILSAEDKKEIMDATQSVIAKNISLQDTSMSDFHFVRLADRLAQWRKQLNPRHGTGIVLIKGLPVASMTPDEVKYMWWGLGLHLGQPGPQNSAGDLIGTVKDLFYNTSRPSMGAYGSVRQYMTADSIPFHCDVADVVGLLCLQQGARGGQSRIASSVAVYNILLQRHPQLIPLLYKTIPLDIRGENGVNYTYVTPAAAYEGTLRTFWHTEYFLSPYRYSDSPVSAVPPPLKQLIDAYDAIANSEGVYYDMEFEVGDAQLISNHVTIHGRTAYSDDDAHRRHLLRLWLSLEEKLSVREEFSRFVMRGKVMLSMLRSVVAAKTKLWKANL